MVAITLEYTTTRKEGGTVMKAEKTAEIIDGH
jgi:hypothetical protein